MKRTTFFLSILFIFSFSMAGLGQASKEDLEKKRDDLMKEIESLQKELNQTKNSKTANLAQLSSLQKKIKAREKVIKGYNTEISMLNREISNKASAVRALGKDLEVLKKNYANMVYYAYKHRSAYDHLVFLFSAKSFNDAFQRLKYIKRYNAYRRQQAELITTTQTDLKKQMGSLRAKKQGRQKLVNEEVMHKKKLAAEKSEKDKMVKSLSKQEKDLKAKIEKKKKEQAKLKAEIAELIKKEIEAAKKKAAASGTTSGTSGSSSLALTPEAAALSAGFANNQGQLPWPVTKGEIREQFGTHAHDVFDNLTVKNNGIDIKTAPNADVRAIFKGTVVGILSNPGYHKAVLVRHGEYFTVYSNLSTVKVKANQEIETKQSLGTAFTEPGAGESIVHLEVWKGTTLLNPEEWILGR